MTLALTAFKYVHLYAIIILWWAALVCYLLYAVFMVYPRYKASWFRPARCTWRSAESWDDVRLILTGDPLKPPCGIRGTDKRVFGVDILKMIAVFAVFCLSGYYVFDPYFPCRLEGDYGGALSDSFLKIIVAVSALVGVIYTAISQLSAKVRSENRQKWINDVRDTIALLINGIPDSMPPRQGNIKSSPENLARMRLELLMNPSERDHRTLGVLLRIAYGIPRIDIDAPVLDELSKLDVLRDLNPWESNLRRDVISKRKNHLISLIVRLSNAMLKREWELVKFGR